MLGSSSGSKQIAIGLAANFLFAGLSGIAAVVWNTVSAGGMVAALGGVTRAELTALLPEGALMMVDGECPGPGPAGTWSIRGTRSFAVPLATTQPQPGSTASCPAGSQLITTPGGPACLTSFGNLNTENSADYEAGFGDAIRAASPRTSKGSKEYDQGFADGTDVRKTPPPPARMVTLKVCALSRAGSQPKAS